MDITNVYVLLLMGSILVGWVSASVLGSFAFYADPDAETFLDMLTSSK